MILRRGDRVSDVLPRVRDHPGRRGLQRKSREHGVPRLLQQPDQRIRDPREPVERDRERDGEQLGLLQGDGLRHELAEDDGKVGEDRERDQERDRSGKWRLEELGEQRLADGTEQDRRNRDPDLNGRDEADRIVHEAESRSPPRPPRSARSSSLRRRAVTRAYSAATKIAFPSTRRNTMAMRREVLTPRQGRRYSAGFRRPR